MIQRVRALCPLGGPHRVPVGRAQRAIAHLASVVQPASLKKTSDRLQFVSFRRELRAVCRFNVSG